MALKWIGAALLAHLLGDFYLQSDALASRKRSSFAALIQHALLYAIPFAVLFALSDWQAQAALFLTVLCAVHFLIDWFKMLLSKPRLWRQFQSFTADAEAILFTADQALHLISIIGFGYFFAGRGLTLAPAPWLANTAAALNLPVTLVGKWLAVILLIYKPANIFFGVYFKRFKPLNPGVPNSEEIRAGRVIGFLERLLIVIFLSLGEYASIGLIMTAKSIARYKRITEEAAFAEYYLIGTLTSILIALLAYLIPFQLF